MGVAVNGWSSPTDMYLIYTTLVDLPNRSNKLPCLSLFSGFGSGGLVLLGHRTVRFQVAFEDASEARSTWRVVVHLDSPLFHQVPWVSLPVPLRIPSYISAFSAAFHGTCHAPISFRLLEPYQHGLTIHLGYQGC